MPFGIRIGIGVHMGIGSRKRCTVVPYHGYSTERIGCKNRSLGVFETLDNIL